MTVALALNFSLSGLSTSVQAASENHAYEIKFSSANGGNSLNGLATSIKKRFSFEQNPIFSNIYTFNSVLTIGRLEQELAGSFDYLQAENELESSAIFVDDPGFTDNPQDIDKQWALPKAGFNQAWSKTTGAVSNVAAIIDTGVDATHEDLQSINFVAGYNFLTQQPINSHTNSDDNGHGTLITGVLGATANNGKGIAGANWSISVMPLKVLDSQGKGDSATVAEAIVWAVDHGANFINMSFGGTGFKQDTTLANAISYAFSKNAVIVAAAGNDVAVNGGSLDTDPVFPVCGDNDRNMIIGVAATDQNDLKATFSNFGKNCIDVVAPGRRILSTINIDPVSGAPAPNSYAYGSGTSLAVPYVTAEAALLRAANPGASNAQIRDRIIQTAVPVDNLNLSQCGGSSCKGLLGSGRINAAQALASPIVPEQVLAQEGDLVQSPSSAAIYQISGGQKRLVSTFVLNQRFLGAPIKTISQAELDIFPDGPYATPLEGTLVKIDGSSAVYIIQNGLKAPITYQVFLQRQLSFASVRTVSYSELNSWVTGNFLPPLEGTLLRTGADPTVYWVVGGVLHPINYQFYLQRGLNIFPVFYVSDQDLNGFSKGEAYVR